LFYGGSGEQLGKQLVGILVTATWSVLGTYIALALVNTTLGLRVSEVNELAGLDETFYGESMIAGHVMSSAHSKGSIFGGVDYAAVELETILELPSLLKHPASPAEAPKVVKKDAAARKARTRARVARENDLRAKAKANAAAGADAETGAGAGASADTDADVDADVDDNACSYRSDSNRDSDAGSDSDADIEGDDLAVDMDAKEGT
jgi:hypothetical protein